MNEYTINILEGVIKSRKKYELDTEEDIKTTKFRLMNRESDLCSVQKEISLLQQSIEQLKQQGVISD